MKTLNRCFVALLACLVFGMAKSASAANYAISPKDSMCFGYTTTISTVAIGPGALYEVTLASGAASEFVVALDTASSSGLTMASFNPTNPGSTTGRLLFGSTTANTQVRFDPPIRFSQGLMVIDSAATGSACYTYELGHGSGN